MSKKTAEKEVKSKYPSMFGSHKVMVNSEKTSALNNPDAVVCTDDFGDYITLASRLDDGLADPARFNGDRLNKLFNKKSDDEK